MHDEVNQEGSEQNEVDGMKKGADSTGKVMHLKKRLVICKEEDTEEDRDGRARVELGFTYLLTYERQPTVSTQQYTKHTNYPSHQQMNPI